ncbi:MAG: glycosyltransferase, partial [Muribaculaceae bacterium]|nr:glycosyltransferase [Muribaculaceae bacterium]
VVKCASLRVEPKIESKSGKMKIAIINKSDSTGGAAVVSFRLMEALRRAGEDARMVVVEKLSDSPFVIQAASKRSAMVPFLEERLKIFIANGFNRDTLFKIDTASDGLNLLSIPFVREADVIMLNWVNQGVLSLKGIGRLAKAGKRLIWTMHDTWCFTGICHHSGECMRFEGVCDNCPLLKGAIDKKLAKHTQSRKRKLYSGAEIDFVAVSNWLAERGARSSLFEGKKPTVIPNAFHFDNENDIKEIEVNKGSENREIKILFGAARLDDAVKGLPILKEMTKILAEKYRSVASRLRLLTFGEYKNPDALAGIAIPHTHLGRISGKENLKNLYREGDIVVSSSLYETLPGTLVEGQVYGAIPVAFPRGGQGDIIDHLSTGYLAPWSDDVKEAGKNLAEGIFWAYGVAKEPEKFNAICRRMYESAFERFNEQAVAESYLDLIRNATTCCNMINHDKT